MPSLKVNDKEIALDAQGFLLRKEDWSVEVAHALAKLDALTLTAEHIDLLKFLRDFYATYQHIPRQRILAKALSEAFGADKASTLYLSRLFKGNPVRLACKYAGLPKPPHCI